MQGQNTHQFQRLAADFGEATPKSFSILYLNAESKEKTLDLIAPSLDIFKNWFESLQSIVDKLQDQRNNLSQDTLYLKGIWDRADVDHSGTLDAKELVQLVSSININLPASTITAMYTKFDLDGNGVMDFNEFLEFMAVLRKR